MRKLLKVTDNDGLIQEGRRLFKAHHYDRGHTIVYEEVDPKEYDKRIEEIARRIASHPKVDLLDILKDALYDLPLRRLDRVEKALTKEEQAEEPEIKTKTTNRGTCVTLVIGRKSTMVLRE